MNINHYCVNKPDESTFKLLKGCFERCRSFRQISTFDKLKRRVTIMPILNI